MIFAPGQVRNAQNLPVDSIGYPNTRVAQHYDPRDNKG